MTTLYRAGFTLIEVLVALAVIGIAFAALGLVQVTNLQATTTARLATDTKTAANQVLEAQLSRVLAEDAGTYAFNSFFWSCPEYVAPPAPPTGKEKDKIVHAELASSECSGVEAVTLEASLVTVSYDIRGVPGPTGEGVLSVSVTAINQRNTNVRLTIGDRVTCYDVYPTPTVTTPEPCPFVVAGEGSATR